MEDNWNDHLDVLRPDVGWFRSADPRRLFESNVQGAIWVIRLNDFPSEPLFTLTVDGADVIHFNEWPDVWGGRPSL